MQEQEKPVESVELKPVDTDSRGYTDAFECTGCGAQIHLYTVMRECDYEFCPYCGKPAE